MKHCFVAKTILSKNIKLNIFIQDKIMPYLKFVSDRDLCSAIVKVIKIIEVAEHDAEDKLHKNVVDPFSALFHGVTHSISYKAWIEQEKARQSQKTMQNATGICAMSSSFVN